MIERALYTRNPSLQAHHTIVAIGTLIFLLIRVDIVNNEVKRNIIGIPIVHTIHTLNPTQTKILKQTLEGIRSHSLKPTTMLIRIKL